MATKNPTLLPCPFCLGVDGNEVHAVEGSTRRWASLHCDCGASRGEVKKVDYTLPATHPENMKALARDWNDRAGVLDQDLPFDRHYVFGYLASAIQHGLEKGDEEIERFSDWLVPNEASTK